MPQQEDRPLGGQRERHLSSEGTGQKAECPAQSRAGWIKGERLVPAGFSFLRERGHQVIL